MYLIDTNVVSEARKRDKANPGVIRFFEQAQVIGDPLYVNVITIGEIRRGIELIRHRGDTRQARQLESWLALLLREFETTFSISLTMKRRCGVDCEYRIQKRLSTNRSPPPH